MRNTLLYSAYETRRRLLAPFYEVSELQAATLRALPKPIAALPGARVSRAIAETVSVLQLTHRRPGFGINAVEVDGEEVAVEERFLDTTPFGRIVHFAKARQPDSQPKVLLLPGLAGHFGTLVRETVRTMLPDHDVYLVDWFNARDVPVQAGRFGLDEFVEHIIEFLKALGPGTHLMAICQPCAAAVTVAAVMAEDEDPAQPASLILLSGPVDARVNPGPVNEAANRYSLKTLERLATTVVPRPYDGAGRRVYPGFMQAMGFLNMAPRRHVNAFAGLLRDVALGHEEAAARTTAFYDEYFAVLDIAAEFYLETARAVFRDHDLARGRMIWRGRTVDPSLIRTALMTVEAENDDMCPPGQTEAAHSLCSAIPATRRRHHFQEGVGHYGVFSGSRFEHEIYPQIRSFVAASQLRQRAGQPALALAGQDGGPASAVALDEGLRRDDVRKRI
jgi:poly(3-hydroxybutyrate) depolymerase